MDTAPNFFFFNKNYTTGILSTRCIDVLAGRTVFVRRVTGSCEDVITPVCSTRDQGEILNSCIFLKGLHISERVFMDLVFVLRHCNVLQEEHTEAGLSSHGRHCGA